MVEKQHQQDTAKAKHQLLATESFSPQTNKV